MSQTPGPDLSIPGFQVMEVAGRGGMGTVYRAEQDSPRREVALKVLNRAQVDEISLAAFRREAEIIAGLEHPRVVPLYTYGEHEGVPYLVLRFLPGGSVADRLEQGPVELEQACAWTMSVAEALAFAHGKSILHRDIKPSNILLDDSGNAYLTDFGIATALEAAGETEQALGSAPYMAPEQIRGQSLDGRSDLYALAAALFEMLTGEVPYPAESSVGMRMRHLHDPVPSARERDPRVPASLNDFLRKGLSKEPEQRFPNASRFSQALDRALEDPQRRLEPAGAPQAGAGSGGPTISVDEQPVSGGIPWAGLVAGGGLLALLAALLVGGAGAFFLLRGGPDDSVAQVGGSVTARPSVAASNTEAATTTPEGRLLADDFGDPDSGFAVGGDEDGGVAYRDGGLMIRVERAGVEWFSPSDRVDRRDVGLETNVTGTEGPGEGHLGFICRWQGPRSYTALAVTPAGETGIWQRRDGELVWLKEWGPRGDWPGGDLAAQRLTALCHGEQLRLELDGQLVIEAADPAPISGDVGLMAGLRVEGAFEVVFDDFLAYQPGR